MYVSRFMRLAEDSKPYTPYPVAHWQKSSLRMNNTYIIRMLAVAVRWWYIIQVVARPNITLSTYYSVYSVRYCG